jgi:hypothetical protein
MKKHILFIILIMFSINLFSDEDGFSLYIKKDYQGAYRAFNEKFVKSDADPLYSYNLGVTANALGLEGEAVYFYLQALQKAPDLTEARNNMQVITSKNNITVPATLLEPKRSIDFVLITFFISIYIFSILVSMSFFSPDWKIKTAMLPVFLVMAVTAVLFFTSHDAESSESWGVVVKSGELKSGPDDSLSGIGNIKEGEIVNIVFSSGSWYKVKSFQDNVEGWVDLSKIRAIMRGYK